MAEFLVLGLLVLVALAIAWLVTGGGALGKSLGSGEQKAEELRNGSTTLHYNPPPGQDPAVLLAELSKAGFQAADERVDGRSRLLIGRADGEPPVRNNVRAVIEHANQTSLSGGPIRHRVVFEDEV